MVHILSKILLWVQKKGEKKAAVAEFIQIFAELHPVSTDSKY